METTVISDKKGPSKILRQPLGGGRIDLFGKNIDDYGRLRRAADQSDQNCGKHVVGGGFNPNSPREGDEVLGNISS